MDEKSIGALFAELQEIKAELRIVRRRLQREEAEYTVAEAARELGIGESTLYRYFNEGRVGSAQRAGRRVVLQRHIDTFREREGRPLAA